MTFKDTKEGSTHSYGDSCGDTEHNPAPLSRNPEHKHPQRVDWQSKYSAIWEYFFGSLPSKSAINSNAAKQGIEAFITQVESDARRSEREKIFDKISQTIDEKEIGVKWVNGQRYVTITQVLALLTNLKDRV